MNTIVLPICTSIFMTFAKCGHLKYRIVPFFHAVFSRFDAPYPQEVFTILIWGSNRESSGTFRTPAAPSQRPSAPRLQRMTAS